MRKRPRKANAAAQFDRLEPRLFLDATPEAIALALDLPDGVAVTYTGDAQAVQTRDLYETGGLLSFPTGSDHDFLMLSTGVASEIDTVANEGSGQGTDLGAPGLAGDTATVSFTLDVPVSDRQQVLKLDYIFLSEEYDEWVGSDFDDAFTVTVDGGILVEAINSSDVDFDGHLETEGTFFDGRSQLIMAWYVIPDLAATIDVELKIEDVTDGLYDSAVLLDNVRIEPRERVWLNFDGMDVEDLFGWGTSTNLPAFETSDIRSTDSLVDTIDAVLARVQTKFSDYAIEFVIDQPADGDYTTAVIGGSDDTVTRLEPIVQTLKDLPPSSTIGDYFGETSILGMADSVDTGNIDKNNLCVVLSGNFADYGGNALTYLANTISHQVGHTLGMRHVDDDLDIMDADTLTPDFVGHDSFTYTITDGDGLTSTATVNVTVGDLPTAIDDEVDVEPDSGPNVIDVLANDTHADPLALVTIEEVTDPSYGTLVNNGTDVTYTPNAGFAGEDTFTYTITDTNGESDTATVTVTVGDLPRADDDEAETLVGDAVTIDVLANDSDGGDGSSLTIISVTHGDQGTVVNNVTDVTYTPDPGATGSDSFTYTISDGAGGEATGVVNVSIGHEADSPTANDDWAGVEAGSAAVVLDVLANDTYLPDLPEALTITDITQPEYGEVVLSEDGTELTFRPQSQSFRNDAGTLSDTWIDDATVQNDYEYLGGTVLGLADGSFLEETDTASTATIIDLTPLNIAFDQVLYDVTIGVFSPSITDVATTYVHLDRLNWTQQVMLPVLTTDAKVFLFASHRRNGPINVVSGTVTDGALSYDDAMVDLLADGEVVSEIPLARLQSSGRFEQIHRNRKGVVSNIPLEIGVSDYTGIQWLDRNAARFNDADGDTYNVRLKNEGLVTVIQDDPDGDGNGGIAQILLEDTTDDSALSVSVRQAGGDGLVQIGKVSGVDLGSITAKAGDLSDMGVWLDGYLGRLTLNDMLAGSAVSAQGEHTQSTGITVHVVNDNCLIDLGSRVGRFQAAQVGDAQIEAPAIDKLTVNGDARAGLPGHFGADLTLGEDVGPGVLDNALGRAKIAGNVQNATWTILSGDLGGASVAGSVLDTTINAAQDIGKLQFGRLVRSNVYAGVRDLFSAEPGSDDELPNSLADFDDATIKNLTLKGLAGLGPALQDSNIAAMQVGSVKTPDILTNNGGTVFGITTDRLGSLASANPALKLRNLRDPQTVTDDDLLIRIL